LQLYVADVAEKIRDWRIKRPQGLQYLFAVRKPSTVAGRNAKGGGTILVDLYDTERQAYFGEITVYPSAGIGGFPREFDRYLGGLWKQSVGRC
jgi:hypothetical protein